MIPGESARPALDGRRLAAAAEQSGLRVEVVDEAASTNAVVADRAVAGETEGLVVVAEHQTAGRGRLDRAWETPARSGLTFSVLLRPTAPARRWPWLPLLSGFAVARVLDDGGFDASVKWPNDVLLGDRKVAGILVERVETAGGPAAVVGVGLNVGMAAAELPVPTATSLALERDGGVPDRTELLVALLRSLRSTYQQWLGDGAGVAESYADVCSTVGRAVRVDLPSGATLHGRAVAIDVDGRLVVDRDGRRTAVSAGDVVHVRVDR